MRSLAAQCRRWLANATAGAVVAAIRGCRWATCFLTIAAAAAAKRYELIGDSGDAVIDGCCLDVDPVLSVAIDAYEAGACVRTGTIANSL